MITAAIVSVLIATAVVLIGLRIGFYAHSIRDPRGYLIAAACIASGGWMLGTLVLYSTA